jgi:hypothetical protein
LAASSSCCVGLCQSDSSADRVCCPGFGSGCSSGSVLGSASGVEVYPGSGLPPDGPGFDWFFETSAFGRGFAFSCHGSGGLSARLRGSTEDSVVVALSEATARSGSLRWAALTTTARITRARATTIMITPAFRSESSLNTRALPSYVESLPSAHVKQPYGRAADYQRQHRPHRHEHGEPTCVW